MSKEELKELLKENLTLEIYETWNGERDIINVEVSFDGDVICKDYISRKSN